jgi:hypothetical protein
MPRPGRRRLRQVYCRETVRNVAFNHGLYASLAPSFPDQIGSSAISTSACGTGAGAP